MDKSIIDICNIYCEKFAPSEKILLDLNEGNWDNFINKKTNKYVDSLSAAIGSEIILPALIFLLSGIGNLILKDGYTASKKRIKEYLTKIENDKNQIKSLSIDKSNTEKTINIIINIKNLDD